MLYLISIHVFKHEFLVSVSIIHSDNFSPLEKALIFTDTIAHKVGHKISMYDKFKVYFVHIVLIRQTN